MYKTFTHDGVEDVVAIEEPLEIRVDGAALAVTMRTPGHDEELALGFLYGEGLIDGPRAAGLTDDFADNTIEVAGPLTRDPGARNFYTTSSCGVCGKGALEEVAVHSAPIAAGTPVLDRALAAQLPDRLTQPTFAAHRRHPRHRPVHRRRRARAHARGRRPPQRDGQGDRPGARSTVCCRCPSTSCASAAGCRSSSSRRRRSPARRS